MKAKEINEKYKESVNALQSGSLELSESLKREADNMFEQYKKEQELNILQLESMNFGIANHIFEERLPELFKSNRKALKEYVNTVKSDKNLLSEALFYNALKKYDGKTDARNYMKECLKLAGEKIDHERIDESNKKVADIMVKFGILPKEKIDENSLALYKSCNYILTNKKKLSNMSTMALMEEEAVKRMGNLTAPISETERKDVVKMISDFEKKYSNGMTSEEKKMFKDIVSENVSVEQKKELFEKCKSDCVNIISELSKKDSDNESLSAVMEEISGKAFNEATAARDIAKLLEIKEVLVS